MAPPIGFFPSLGTPELIIILLVGLILFGGRLPEVGRSIGRSLVEFRKGLRSIKEETGLDEISKVKDEIRDLARLPAVEIEEDEEPDPDVPRDLTLPLGETRAAEEDLTKAASEGLAGMEPAGGVESERQPEESRGADQGGRDDDPPRERGTPAQDAGAPPPFGYRSARGGKGAAPRNAE